MVLDEKNNREDELEQKETFKVEDEPDANEEKVEAETNLETISEAEEEILEDDDKIRKMVLKKQKMDAKKAAKEAKRLAKIEKENIKKKKLDLEAGLSEIQRYEADPNVGLTEEQVKDRMNMELNNVSHNGSTKSIKRIILTNVFTFFNMLTVAIAGWLISVKAFTDLFFLVIVTLNVVIGIIQEIKAKNTIDKLSFLTAPTAIILRDGNRSEIKVSEVVLDDILLLESGKQICSDSIVIDGSIEVNESLLTGESDAIVKKKGDKLFSGSFVISGNCKARVDKVGKDNYIEQLSNEARSYRKPKSDLMRSLNLIIIVMACVIIPIGATLFYMQYINNGIDYVTAVRKTAGAMVGMIPSGLFLLSSVALAVGVIKLGQNNVMVQELYCIEMLARVNVLCLDKTGTITDGTMSVKNVVEFNTIGGMSTKYVVGSMLNALKEKNLTSVALEEKFGTNRKLKAKGIIPFSSQRKYNAVSFDRLGTFIMGAPEFVMKDKYVQVKKDVERYASEGYRVLLLAHKADFIENGELPQGDITVVAMVLIEDNIRPDAIKTIQYFKDSGVEVKVISGDNPLTVAKISERAGINGAKDYISLDGLTDAEVERAATKYTVFGRVSPNQKRILIKSMKETGKTVAMTGDGVNDILALKEADCSIAVASGSEAARNVSHLVLLDSNFDSMPKVVAEGRRVINNVAGVACLFLTKTIFSFLLAIQAMNSAGVYPISTNQLAMIDFLVTGIPSFFLVLEPNNKEVDGNFLKNIIMGALPGAITILICSMIAFQLVDYLGLDFLTSSTIIVIVATHTCMMVLFKVCRPFNLLRKILFGTAYTLFVVLTILLPQFFEFRPLFKFMQYYSDAVEIKSLEEIPTITISKENRYVIDGYITEYIDVNDSQTYTISATANGFLSVDRIETNIPIEVPIASLGLENMIYLKGYQTEILYSSSSNYDFVIDSKGYVTLIETDKDSNTELRRESFEYSILPSIVVTNNHLQIDSDVHEDYLFTEPLETVTINPETWEILLNGKVYPIKDNGNLKLEKPSITCNIDGYIVIDADSTGAVLGEETATSLAELVVVATGGTNGNNNNYCLGSNDKEIVNYYRTQIPMIRPEVETSVQGRYVIDGSYTEYEATQVGGDSATTLTFTEDGRLVINGIETDYHVSVMTTTGGIVQRLSIPAILLLVMLCLLAGPAMRILQQVVPWIKNLIRTIQHLLSKL